MFTINPLYAAIGGGLAVIAVAGTFRYQSDQIHKYHSLYNCVSSNVGCAKGSKLVTVPDLQVQIALMKQGQRDQTAVTQHNVNNVIKPRTEVITKIKEIKVPVEVAADCPTPEIPEELMEFLP